MDFKGNFVQIINGKASPTEASRNGVNPANKTPLWDVPLATKADVDRAAEAGKEAFKTWSQVPYEERKKAVLAYADAVEKYKNEFRDLVVTEQGKAV